MGIEVTCTDAGTVRDRKGSSVPYALLDDGMNTTFEVRGKLAVGFYVGFRYRLLCQPMPAEFAAPKRLPEQARMDAEAIV